MFGEVCSASGLNCQPRCVDLEVKGDWNVFRARPWWLKFSISECNSVLIFRVYMGKLLWNFSKTKLLNHCGKDVREEPFPIGIQLINIKEPNGPCRNNA